jgi:hypothetical protein
LGPPAGELSGLGRVDRGNGRCWRCRRRRFLSSIRASTQGCRQQESGLAGNITDFTFGPASKSSNTSLTTAWFPNERLAKAWPAIATGQPVQP